MEINLGRWDYNGRARGKLLPLIMSLTKKLALIGIFNYYSREYNKKYKKIVPQSWAEIIENKICM